MQHSEKTQRPAENKSSSQPLKIDSPDSVHEKEAQSTAEKVTRNGQIIGSENSWSGQIAGNSNPNKGMIAPAGVQEQINSTKGSGDKLPDSVKRMVKGKSGELDEVRIHTDSMADRLAKSVNAEAFTYGTDIYFGAGKFNSYTSEGKKLIVHEVEHAKQSNIFSSGVIQRAPVNTYYGLWDTEWFDELNKDGQGNTCDPYGVDIKLCFTPGDKVESGKIGLIQIGKHIEAGEITYPSYLGYGYQDSERRSIKAKESIQSKELNTNDAGFGIDKFTSLNNPLYQTNTSKPGGKLEDAPVSSESVKNKKTGKSEPAFGSFGKRVADGKGGWVVEPSTLLDTPGFQYSATDNSSQTFETAAYDVIAKQYLGSVKWGWTKDTQGKFEKIPVQKVTDIVPSSTFLLAADKWSKNKVKENTLATVPLPSETVRLAKDKAPFYDKAEGGTTYRELNAGTRLQLIHYTQQGMNWMMHCQIVSGTLVGEKGWIDTVHTIAER